MDDMSVPFTHPFQENQFDLFVWDPKYQSCIRYFLDHAQHEHPVQAVARMLNIRLPLHNPSAIQTLHPPPGPSSSSRPYAEVSTTLIPYIRRLIVTGFDTPAVLHGFFGDDWLEGIGSIHETERRNYLFAIKSDNWLAVKRSYDMDNGQTVPWLKPPQNVSLAEIEAAEKSWSEWLSAQDWMLGPRALKDDD